MGEQIAIDCYDLHVRILWQLETVLYKGTVYSSVSTYDHAT